MAKRFPAVIHVTWESLDNDDDYMQVSEDGVFGVAEAGKSKRVALYKLVEVGAVIAPPRYVKPERKSR